MAQGDVETIDKRGQWVNRVTGDPERSQSFSDKQEAIDAGRALAEELGTKHTVHDAEATGVITDPGDDQPTPDDLKADDPEPVDRSMDESR